MKAVAVCLWSDEEREVFKVSFHKPALLCERTLRSQVSPREESQVLGGVAWLTWREHDFAARPGRCQGRIAKVELTLGLNNSTRARVRANLDGRRQSSRKR